ncbi:MAG: tetratricopeptide repeat protein [Planctomycetes bacterium]|nr:tetratricopeptide repeat protein [Planctomycetota bacterium]
MARVRIPTARLALTLLESGRHREAETVCRQVLKAQRRNFGALHVLGVTLGQQNRFEEAKSCFERALKVQPGAAVIHCGLGKLYSMQGMFDEALAWYERGLDAQPGSLLALAGKAETLTRRGDYDLASEVLRPVLASGVADGEVVNIHAETLRNAGRHEEAITVIERALAAPGAAAVTQRKLAFALGNSYTKTKDYERAFNAYRRANELCVQPFDLVRRRRSLDRLVERFQPDAIAERPRSTNDSELPVFIVGMPRSGSTLTEQIIAAHPRAFGAGEILELPQLMREIHTVLGRPTRYPIVVDDVTVEELDRLADQLIGRYQPYDPGALRIVDKHLENYVFLGLLAMMVPRARVIHCKRDPMSICFSMYTMPLSPLSHPYSTDLRNLGHFYREYERMMDHWRTVIDMPFLEVQYEELVADQETWSRRLIDFCGLEWDDACLRFHETGRDVATASYDQVRKPMYETALKRYEAFDAHLGPLKEALGIDGSS